MAVKKAKVESERGNSGDRERRAYVGEVSPSFCVSSRFPPPLAPSYCFRLPVCTAARVTSWSMAALLTVRHRSHTVTPR